ncbi:MAG TPA: class I SAM-dependent methyltransferase [Vicinamibacterales bacterium]|nr:class I SAM-dependent methyltransferase [Vicinamibacterales bacterium]
MAPSQRAPEPGPAGPPPDFFRLYEGLPRQGPGSDDLTREALRRLGPLPGSPRVLDLGCGTGRQTLVLARDLATRVVAVDNHVPFLHELDARAAAASLSHLVETRAGDMRSLDVPEGSVDLIWSEGAIYLLGFENGLRTWRPWLAAGGKLAVSECSWLTDDPADDLRAFWDAAYPTMGTVAANCAAAGDAGFEVLDTVPLPRSAWWDDYYTPLLARVGELEPEAQHNAVLAEAIAETRSEVALFERFGDAYGYVFYLCRKR